MTTYFLKDTAVNGFGSLSETDPGASTTGTGWTVAKIAAARFAIMIFGSEQASGALTTTDDLTTPAAPASGDSWRSENTINGSFANANWTLTFAVRAVSVASTQRGRIKFRMWRSTNASGSGATQITSATQTCSIIAGISTSADNTTSLTFNPGAVTLTNEYLFVQVEWETTTAGGNNSADILFRASASTVVTSTFTPATQDLAPDAVHTNSNSFFSPTTTYIVEPSLHANTNTFFTHDLDQTIPDQDLTQDTTFANTNSYFTQTLTAGSVDLAPALFTNTQSFFTSTLTIDITPSLYTNSQTYFTHTIVAIGGEQELFPPLFVEENIFELGSPDWFWEHFIQSGDDAILLPLLFANTNTFFTHLVSLPDLFASLYTNTNTFFSPTIAYVVQPPLHTNSNSFFTHALTVGAVDLAPSLFTNTNSFFTHVISAGDATLTPSLFTNTNTFFGHTLETSTVNLAPPLHTNTNSFFGPTISLSLAPSLFTNTNTFFGPTITLSLTPALFTNTNTFFSATVSLSLAPSLFTNTNTFFAHTVSAGAVDLAPALYTNTNTFFTHVVFRETQFIEPSLYTDPDTFFGGAVEQEGAPGAGTALNNPFIMSVGAMSVR